MDIMFCAEVIGFQIKGFIYHNQKILDVQKKIYLLKRMGTNLIQGKSIMSISLPIELFDKKSHLEILANNFTYA